MNLLKTLSIGLIASPILLFISCNTKNKYLIQESIDSFPRLKPGDACYPKSSFNPKFSLICYYNSTLNTVFFESKDNKGKFIIKNHGEFVTFYPHNLDTIFFMFDDSLIIYNSKGEILKSIFYKRKFLFKNNEYRIGKTVLDVPNLNYNSDHQILYLPCSNSETNWWNKKYFSNSMIIVGLDIKTDSVIYLSNFKYPSQYTKYSYGELANYFYTIKNNHEIYFSFNAIPEIYKYELNSIASNPTEIFLSNLKNIPTYDTAYNEDLNMVVEYQKQIDTYWKIIYDPFKNLFYRFHTQPTNNEAQKKHGSYTAHFDVILIIYDANFKELYRFNYGDTLNHYGTFVSHKGLHLKLFKPSEKYEYFKILSITI